MLLDLEGKHIINITMTNLTNVITNIDKNINSNMNIDTNINISIDIHIMLTVPNISDLW